MLRSMIECHFWANQAMLDSLELLAPEQFTQHVESSFPSVQATAAHILNSERFLLGNLRGERLPALDPEALKTVSGLRSAWGETEALWRAQIDHLDEAALTADLTFRFGSGQTVTLKAWQVIHQFLVHTPYHRGQVITLLRQVGGTVFKTDAHRFHLVQNG